MTQVLMRAGSTPWGKKIPARVVPSGTSYTLDHTNSVMVDSRDVDTLSRYGFSIVGFSGSSVSSSTAEVLVAVRTLTADEINSFHSSPITLVETPGAGLIIVTHKILPVLKAGSIAFGCRALGEAMATFIHYSGEESPPILIASEPSDSLVFCSAEDCMAPLDPPNSPIGAIPLMDNRAVILDHIDTDFSDFGAISDFNIASGGSDYVQGDTGTITSTNGTTVAEYEITEEGEGAVTGLDITLNPGGYQLEEGLNTVATSGEGTGLVIDVTEITPGNGTGIVAVYYSILDSSR